MYLYLIKDNLSGQIQDVVVSSNLETYKRSFINSYLSLKEKNNFTAIRLLNDCDVYEVKILSVTEISNPVYKDELCLWGKHNYSDCGICAEKVLVLKEFIADFESKKGSNLDKSE